METKKNFTYQDTNSEYVLVLKKRNYWWLLLFLLLLLPLLLLIKLEKTVVFKTVDAASSAPISSAKVKFAYVEREFFNFKTKKFFTADTIRMADSTSKEGIVLFKKCTYTLYQVLFHSKEITDLYASAGCYTNDSTKHAFSDLKHEKETLLKMASRSWDLGFQVIDRDDNQPIPDAKVTAICKEANKNWSETADANGMVVLKGVPLCSELFINGEAYGYEKDTIRNQAKYLAGDEQLRKLRLKPLKDMVKFEVKDLYSKQPLPNALAELILEKQTIKVRTNTNGVGKGVFENVKVLQQMQIKASHDFYFDTITQKYKVADFIKMSDEQRTVYLRPQTQSLTFRNTNAANGQPLEGVNNEITINGVKKGTQMSNSNGTFLVAGLKPSDKITIVASKSGFSTNSSKVNNKTVSELNTDDSRNIPLGLNPPPDVPKPPRKNCRAFFAGTLVSDEPVESHISVVYQVDKYSEYVGEGEYPDNTVAFPKAVATTFDGIAIDKGTRVIIYSKKNFKGEVLLDKTGPAIINNIKWVNNVYIKDFQRKRFKGDLEANFPQSCREWSKNNMNDWSYGSLKIICGQ